MYLQPAESEIWTCVGWWPLKLHVYVMSSPSTMVAGLMLRDAVHESPLPTGSSARTPTQARECGTSAIERGICTGCPRGTEQVRWTVCSRAPATAYRGTRRLSKIGSLGGEWYRGCCGEPETNGRGGRFGVWVRRVLAHAGAAEEPAAGPAAGGRGGTASSSTVTPATRGARKASLSRRVGARFAPGPPGWLDGPQANFRKRECRRAREPAPLARWAPVLFVAAVAKASQLFS